MLHMRNHRYSYRMGATLALKMAARAYWSALKGCSGLLRRRQSAQNGRSGLPRCRQCAQKGCSSLLRCCQCAQNGHSGLLWCHQCAQKACSSPLQCTECAQRGCSSPLFEITIQKCWSRLYSDLSHCTLLHFAPCMDMHGFTLVYICLYMGYRGNTKMESESDPGE